MMVPAPRRTAWPPRLARDAAWLLTRRAAKGARLTEGRGGGEEAGSLLLSSCSSCRLCRSAARLWPEGSRGSHGAAQGKPSLARKEDTNKSLYSVSAIAAAAASHSLQFPSSSCCCCCFTPGGDKERRELSRCCRYSAQGGGKAVYIKRDVRRRRWSRALAEPHDTRVTGEASEGKGGAARGGLIAQPRPSQAPSRQSHHRGAQQKRPPGTCGGTVCTPPPPSRRLGHFSSKKPSLRDILQEVSMQVAATILVGLYFLIYF